MEYEALTRDQVASVIDGRGAAPRVPVLLHFWISAPEFQEREQAIAELLAKYPEDAQYIGVRIPDVYEAPADDAEYRWMNFSAPAEEPTKGLDERGAISDWNQLDGILKNFPNPRYAGLFPSNPSPDGRYRLATWWYCLFERHWQLRGMTNALMDYYTDAESVHKLFRAVTDFYLVIMERAKAEAGADGIFTSDDLGTQTGPFFGPDIFNEFYKPYYKELADKAHSLGMHFWLHTCGNIEKYMPEFINVGIDVIHPIQKYTMDEARIARKYGHQICIWAGFDVQRIIPFGTPEEVRREVRFLMDTFHRPDGRMMLTAGNAVKRDCPTASLEALFDEAFKYGTETAAKRKAQ
jgi:uroporphyrinogen decarboxylase